MKHCLLAILLLVPLGALRAGDTPKTIQLDPASPGRVFEGIGAGSKKFRAETAEDGGIQGTLAASLGLRRLDRRPDRDERDAIAGQDGVNILLAPGDDAIELVLPFGLAVAQAEGEKRSVELSADAELYSAQKQAEAVRVAADAEAYAIKVKAAAT